MRSLYPLASLLVCFLAGCPRYSPQPPAQNDGIVWDEQGIKYVDYSISLGHRLLTDAGARSLEPVTTVTHNGTSSASVMVFNQLRSVDGRDVSEPEAATVYEVASGADVGHYTPAAIKLPADAAQCVVQYRVVFPNSEQVWKNDITIALK